MHVEGQMKVVVAVILAVVVLVLTFSLPALAQEEGAVIITMTGTSEISIILEPTQWSLGQVAPDTDYPTTPAIEWCTVTVTGNSEVNLLIVGEDAVWVEAPDEYKWTLSDDGTNGEDMFGLWFRISGDTERGPYGDGHVPVTNTESEFWPHGDGESLQPGDSKEFGLTLYTPSSFIGGREMQTRVRIMAVAP